IVAGPGIAAAPAARRQRRVVRQAGRVAPPRKGVVEEGRGSGQDQAVQPDRVERVGKAQFVDRRAADHGGERGRAPRRMDAARQVHDADRAPHRRRARQGRLGDHELAQHAHERRQHVAGKQRPGLGELAVWRGEHDHRGRAER
ncbi:hypothetical protein RZS08_16270, partial [Arthrospira platensis SPKY1]|nr:hypothetical protein [Arthrospira platensis SPKY1]